jgi:hypothetical protein
MANHDEAAREEIETILGVKSEDTGGGCECFVFYRPGGAALYFGWADGNLGYSLMSPDGGDCRESGEMPKNSDAISQAQYIAKVAERLGFKVAEAQIAAVDGQFLAQAQEAFWAVIAAKYPKIKTGDLFPDESLKFDDACAEAVKTWIMRNGGH